MDKKLRRIFSSTVINESLASSSFMNCSVETIPPRNTSSRKKSIREKNHEKGSPLELGIAATYVYMHACKSIEEKLNKAKLEYENQMTGSLEKLKRERDVLCGMNKQIRDLNFCLEKENILNSESEHCANTSELLVNCQYNLQEIRNKLCRTCQAVACLHICIPEDCSERGELQQSISETTSLLQDITDPISVDTFIEMENCMSAIHSSHNNTKYYLQRFQELKAKVQSGILLKCSQKRSQNLINELCNVMDSECDNRRMLKAFLDELRGGESKLEE